MILFRSLKTSSADLRFIAFGQSECIKTSISSRFQTRRTITHEPETSANMTSFIIRAVKTSRITPEVVALILISKQWQISKILCKLSKINNSDTSFAAALIT